MKIVSDKLAVVFENSDDVAGICVSKVVNGKTTILKMELREQAYILYRLLTEQTTKAEIKVENDEVLEQDTVPFDFELYQAGLMDLPMEIRSIVATVLDDIKKKIEGLNPIDYVSISSYEGHKGARDIKDDILQIIDEYKNGELSNDEGEMDKNSPTARR